MTSLLSLIISNVVVLYIAWVLYNDEDYKDFSVILKNYLIFIDLFYIIYIMAWSLV